MGEEVREPQKTIPKAIIVTMLLTMTIYMAIATVSVGAVGAANLSSAIQGAAPLEVAVRRFEIPGITDSGDRGCHCHAGSVAESDFGLIASASGNGTQGICPAKLPG